MIIVFGSLVRLLNIIYTLLVKSSLSAHGSALLLGRRSVLTRLPSAHSSTVPIDLAEYADRRENRFVPISLTSSKSVSCHDGDATPIGEIRSAGVLSLWIVIVVSRRIDFASLPSKLVRVCFSVTTVVMIGVQGGEGVDDERNRRRRVTQDEAAM